MFIKFAQFQKFQPKIIIKSLVARELKGINMIVKIGYGHLCLRMGSILSQEFRVANPISCLCCPIVFLRSEFRCRKKQCSVCLFPLLFLFFRYFCLLAHSGVQHILCCVFVLFVFVICTISCQFLWVVNFWIALQCFLTFISSCIENVMLDAPCSCNKLQMQNEN